MTDSGAEERLLARGVAIEERGGLGDDGIYGAAVLWPLDDGTRVFLAVRPGLDVEQRALFADWALSRLQRYLEHGPEPDGWAARSDGGYQLHARLQHLPEDPTL